MEREARAIAPMGMGLGGVFLFECRCVREEATGLVRDDKSDRDVKVRHAGERKLR